MKRIALSTAALKRLALVFMLADHLAWTFLDADSLWAGVLHFAGAAAMPLFVFLLTEGYHHTHDLKKYALRLFLFSLISWVPFSLFSALIRGEAPSLSMLWRLSMLFSLLLALAALYWWDRAPSPGARVLGILLLCAASLPGDGMFFPLLLALAFHIFREKPLQRTLAAVAVSLALVALMAVTADGTHGFWAEAGCHLGMIPAVFLPLCVSGKRGHGSKWFYYVFYPAHLAVLSAVMLLT